MKKTIAALVFSLLAAGPAHGKDGICKTLLKEHTALVGKFESRLEDGAGSPQDVIKGVLYVYLRMIMGKEQDMSEKGCSFGRYQLPEAYHGIGGWQ